jgi:hypothetical protein
MSDPRLDAMTEDQQCIFMLLYWEHAGRTFAEVKREEDQDFLEYLIQGFLDAITDTDKKLKALRDHHLINDIWVDYMLRFLAKNPEIRKTAMNMILEPFPEIKKQFDEWGCVSLETAAEGFSLPPQELKNMLEEHSIGFAPTGEA